jgi:dienelactone hydrolase
MMISWVMPLPISQGILRFSIQRRTTRFEIAIPHHKIPPRREEARLIDGQGNVIQEFEAGDNLLVSFFGLSPSRSFTVRLSDDAGKTVVSASLVADRNGNIRRTVLWPDIGIGIPEKGGSFAFETIEEAHAKLAGRSFVIEILDKKKVILTTDFTIAKEMRKPQIHPVSKSGALQRGMLSGKDDLRIHGRNLKLRPGHLVNLYLVERQYDWQVGDAIVPVRNSDGSEVVVQVRFSDDESSFTAMLWPHDEVRPGSYDVIARAVLEYEFQADERLLRSTDIVSERYLTTVVIRDDIMRVKPVLLGCVNAQDVAGRLLDGTPYFRFTNNFPKGTDVYAALDPAGLAPEAIGKKVRIYVVQHKDAGQWSADSSLIDITGTVKEIVTSPSCINYNDILVWDNPQQVGQYDLVVDFGNNSPDPNSFVADDSFDPPLDIIDGYFKVGFYVTEDPSVGGSFAVGRTTYSAILGYQPDPVTIPAVGVWHWQPPDYRYGDTITGELDLPMFAQIRYPADVSGEDVAVSSLQPDSKDSYPLVVVMHGQHTTLDPSYQGYSYLLDHLASHGFIAVSIDCNAINAIGGCQDTRGHAMLEHLSLLQFINNSIGSFQGRIDMTRIGIMGHSRGGDGAVQAEIYNQSLGLGFDIKAVVALAPTDFSGTSPDPLVLTTSKFLCIYGSNDGDVWGGYPSSSAYTGTGFRFYDRATVEKAMVFIYNATHNGFNREWGIDGKLDSTLPNILTDTQHELLLRGYMTAFMQVHLLGRQEQNAYFTGELKIPQVDEVEVYTQYRQPIPNPRTLDDFESTPEIDKNILNGDVEYSDLGSAPQEDAMGTLDTHSPHQTQGLKLEWDVTTARYQTEIPLINTQRNVSNFEFLSFRVSQVVNGNPVGQMQDLYVRLNTAEGGNSRAVRVGYFGHIPYPHRPDYKSSYDSYEDIHTKAALTTIRIPLHAWTIKALSAPIVNLTNIESIAFEFNAKPTGEILIDDIEFIK